MGRLGKGIGAAKRFLGLTVSPMARLNVGWHFAGWIGIGSGSLGGGVLEVAGVDEGGGWGCRSCSWRGRRRCFPGGMVPLGRRDS